MRDSNFVTKTIAVAAFLAVMVYFATRLGGYLVDPLITTAAYYYQSDDAVTVTGYVVRQEELLPLCGRVPTLRVCIIHVLR